MIAITPTNNITEQESATNSAKDKKDHVGFRVKIKRFFQKFELKAGAPQNLLMAGLWQTVGTLLASLFGWLLIVIVSRKDIGLGPEGVGILNTALAIYGIFSLVLIGISKATSQMVSENISNKKIAFEHARNGTFIILLTGIIMGSGLIISSFFVAKGTIFQTELSAILFIIGIVVLIAGFRDGLISNLAAVGEYDDIVKAYTTYPLFQVISAIVLIVLIKFTSLPLTLILFVYICGATVQALVLYKFFRRLWFNALIFRFTQVDRRAFRILRHGFYFSITDLIPMGLLGAVSILLLLMFTQDYNIVGAYSIIMGYSTAGLAVSGFAWPLITSIAEAYGQNNSEKIHNYIQLITKIFFYITFFTLALNIGLSRGLLFIFHGALYTTGTTDVWIPFILVIIAFAIAGFEYILCSIILGIGKGRAAATYLGSLFLIIVGFIVLFVPILPFSPQINVGLGFLTGACVMLPFLPYLMKKYLNHGLPAAIGLRSIAALTCTILVAALLTWPPLELLPLNNIWMLMLISILLVVIYPILLIFFGAISEKDFELLEKKMNQFGLKSLAPLLAFFRKIMRHSPFRPITD